MYRYGIIGSVPRKKLKRRLKKAAKDFTREFFNPQVISTGLLRGRRTYPQQFAFEAKIEKEVALLRKKRKGKKSAARRSLATATKRSR